MSAPLTVYSCYFCPFAQRTRIQVALKEIPHELVEIDLSKPRPAWFLEKNPLGKVPAIEHDGQVIYESSIIGEYLEEAYAQRPLLPADPLRRAQARLLIAIGNERFVPAMYRLLMEQEASRHEELRENALASWREIDAFLRKMNPAGSWLFDDVGFGLVEASFAGFFQRYCLNEHFRWFSLPGDAAYERVRRWRDAILAHPVIGQTGVSDDDFIKLYADYAQGYGNAQLPPGAERSSFDLAVPLHERPMPPRGPAPASPAR
ncbi:glutathione S-transferase family protein [Vulgatibacter sp.]|uniref:glutathione S-transferase family protein n=1 Tax=Vulgatibacter sp. TaxID=1971226 RepID=UPI003561E816